MECGICRDTISEPETSLPCGHLFHTECMKNWRDKGGRCPFFCKNSDTEKFIQCVFNPHHMNEYPVWDKDPLVGKVEISIKDANFPAHNVKKRGDVWRVVYDYLFSEITPDEINKNPIGFWKALRAHPPGTFENPSPVLRHELLDSFIEGFTEKNEKVIIKLLDP